MKDLKARHRFREWQANHPDHKLAYLFIDFKPDTVGVWQVGFFKDLLITSFTLDKKLEIAEDQEVYPTNGGLFRLDLDSVKVGSTQAIGIGEARAADHQPFNKVQTLAVLQTVDGTQVWNITLFSRELHLLNVKIDARSGGIVSENISPIFDMAQPMEGNGEA